MQKEKKVRAYTRKVNGKTVTVKAHTAKYDAAEEARKAFAKREGAGKELEKVKIKKVAPAENDLGFTEADYKAWYHWDMVDDPNNPQALKVKRALTKTMGRKGYQAYEDQMSDTYSARGHMKGFKNISAGSEKPAEKSAPKETSAKTGKAKEKKSSVDSKGNPKVIAQIDQKIASYEREAERIQKHIDNGDRIKKPSHWGIRRGSYERDSWGIRQKRNNSRISQLKKAKEYHIAGKENATWNILKKFSGFNENAILSKDTRSKNAAAKERERQREENKRIQRLEEEKARILRYREERNTPKTTPKKSSKK
jgi:hypothetical protein